MNFGFKVHQNFQYFSGYPMAVPRLAFANSADVAVPNDTVVTPVHNKSEKRYACIKIRCNVFVGWNAMQLVRRSIAKCATVHCYDSIFQCVLQRYPQHLQHLRVPFSFIFAEELDSFRQLELDCWVAVFGRYKPN